MHTNFAGSIPHKGGWYENILKWYGEIRKQKTYQNFVIKFLPSRYVNSRICAYLSYQLSVKSQNPWYYANIFRTNTYNKIKMLQ